MKRLLAALLLLALLIPASALALTGQTYTAFLDYYKSNINFINENDNRHLLPMVLSQTPSQKNDGRIYYELVSDVLNVKMTADIVGVIEECTISLTAPNNMEYGSSVYNDFAISGYHSYALLMAMDTRGEAADRYALVTDVVQGMKDGDGVYTRQIGAYTLTCSRENSIAILHFINNGVPVETPTPNPSTSPSPSDGTAPAPEDTTTVSDEDFIG